MYLCSCDCGRKSWIRLAHINLKEQKMCSRCNCSAIATTHGESTSSFFRTYRAWSNMRRRVASDKSYVKRGIKCCARWESYMLFKKDMGDSPDGMQLDRIDGSRGYSPSNCRWVTPKENNANRQNLRMITFDGLTMCVAHWEKHLGLRVDVLRKRLNSKLPLWYLMTPKKLRSGRGGDYDFRIAVEKLNNPIQPGSFNRCEV